LFKLAISISSSVQIFVLNRISPDGESVYRRIIVGRMNKVTLRGDGLVRIAYLSSVVLVFDQTFQCM